MNKRNRNIVIAVSSIVLILALVGLLIFFFKPFSQSIIEASSYTCPTGKVCSVTPILSCSYSDPNSKVILRTNAMGWNVEDYKSLGTSVALDTNKDGALESFTRGTSGSGCAKDGVSSTNLFKDKNIGIDFIYVYNNNLYICYSSSQAYKWVLGGNVPTSLSHVAGWNEKTSGSLYTCSRDILINNEVKDTLSYNADTPTNGKRGNTYSLLGGDKISFFTGQGGTSFDYSISDIPVTTCITSNGTILQIGQAVCSNQYLLEKCENINNKPTLTKQDAIPPQVCRNGALTDAYHVDITVNKLILGTSDKLIVDFYLKDTPDNKNKDITAKICKNNDCSFGSSTLTTGNTYSTAGKVQFNFDAPPVGYYTLKISFSHPDGDFSKEYNLQVTQDLSVVLTAKDIIQYSNKDIIISLESFKSGDYKDLTNWEVQATFNGIVQNDYTTSHPDKGIRTLSFPLQGKGDGTLRVKARGQDETGLWTEWTNWFEITVKKSTILIYPDFKTDVCTGNIINSFETKDPTGAYVETTNQITIDKACGGTDTVTASGSLGKYSFTYNYACGGINTIRITSTNPELGSSQLNQGQGRVVNILTGTACEGGGCEGIGCYTNYIIFGIAIVAVGLFIYFVFFFRRKK